MSITRDGDLLVDDDDARTFAPWGDGDRREQLRSAAEHLSSVVAFLDAEAADADDARRAELAAQVEVEGLTEGQVRAVLAAAAAAAEKQPKKGGA